MAHEEIVDLDDVLQAEREELALRRNQAGFRHQRQTEPDHLYQPEDIDDPVGLAVSGGGVRSAAFSLGVLQAFYERGLLRFCDYLSTVSGGSYVGGFLSSLAVHGHTDLRWTGRESASTQNGASNGAASRAAHCNGSSAGVPSPPPTTPSPATRPSSASVADVRQRTDTLAERITIEPDDQRRQPHYVRRLVLGSSYLERPLLFFSHWLPGFLQNNLIALSSLLCVCALVAWLFRLLDTDNWMRVLRALGFSDDISRAYFPAVVLFGVWALVLGYRALKSFLGNRTGRTSVAPSLTLLLLITGLLSTVSLIGVGDVSTSLFLHRLNIPLNPEFIAYMQTVAQWVLYTVLAAAIIPYLSADALLRSGSAGASWRDRFIFRFATHAMLWGVPLVVFGLLASENISQHNRLREDHYLLSNNTIANWPDFVAVLKPNVSTSAASTAPVSPPPTAPTSPPPTAPASPASSNPTAPEIALESVQAKLWKQLEGSTYPASLPVLGALSKILPTESLTSATLDESPADPSAAALLQKVANKSQHRIELERHTSFGGRISSCSPGCSAPATTMASSSSWSPIGGSNTTATWPQRRSTISCCRRIFPPNSRSWPNGSAVARTASYDQRPPALPAIPRNSSPPTRMRGRCCPDQVRCLSDAPGEFPPNAAAGGHRRLLPGHGSRAVLLECRPVSGARATVAGARCLPTSGRAAAQPGRNFRGDDGDRSAEFGKG